MPNNEIKYLRFNNEKVEGFVFENLDDINIEEDSIHWVHISSLEDDKMIEELGRKFNISPIVVDSIRDISLLPRVENYKDYIFMILEDIQFNPGERLRTKQLSLILFKNMVISIEEKESNIFETISEKINDRINIIESIADNIFFELIDITIEDYFDVLEGIGERIDEVEDKLLLEPTKETLSEIYALACWIFIFPVLATRLMI